MAPGMNYLPTPGLDADRMRNSMFFPILDVTTFFPLFSIPLIVFSVQSGSPTDKVPQ